MSLEEAADLSIAMVGSKAATLARLARAGLPVPPGLVATSAAWSEPTGRIAAEFAAALSDGEFARTDRFAVRSSAASEDLPQASYAGQYETFLGVSRDEVSDAAQRCARGATASRVAAYRSNRDVSARPLGSTEPIAVLAQPMVAAEAAGVAFTANPVTGDRTETVVTAVRGLGERLVGGETVGDEWSVRGGSAAMHRSVEGAITAEQAVAVAALASQIVDQLGGPQDIEWAIETSDRAGRLILLQARPMTALPDPVEWAPPGPGIWWRNFRLGEWLPDPITPLFADWLLHRIELGYLDGMRDTLGTAEGFRYATVNGWYYNSLPTLTAKKVVRALRESRGRGIPVIYHGVVRLAWDAPGADRAVLGRLYRHWRDRELPAYREQVTIAELRLPSASSADLVQIVDEIGRTAGRHLWCLAFGGGAAWKMESRLTTFAKRYLRALTDPGKPLADGVQVLLRALPGADPTLPDHAVHSVDWYWPTHGETVVGQAPPGVDPARKGRLMKQRDTAERACLEALASSPARRRRFAALLDVTRRYTVIREAQARDWTLGWPLLRRCALGLGDILVAEGSLDHPEQVFFVLRSALTTRESAAAAEHRRVRWQRQCRTPAPLTLGKPIRLIGDPLARAASSARGTRPVPDNAIVGQPASAGRASGPIRLVVDPADFDTFEPGDILLAHATTPAWTPLFAAAAAVITDSGTAAAHASIVAREYGIPAVVGTGDATHRLRTGQWVTVDGTTGTIIQSL